VQIKAGAYLLPVDIEAENESQVEKTAYSLNDLTDKLAEAKPAFTLVMVDACRSNPMKSKGRAIGNARGLNALEPPKGQMVVYSASKGQEALDRLSDSDTNPNGVFTREFIKRMRTPGVRIEDLMRDVQDSVESLAKSVQHEQRPAIYNEARGNFYFYGPTTVQIQQGSDDSEAQTWAAAQAVNSVTAYQRYLDAYPKGKYVVAAKIKLDAINQSSEKLLPDTEADQWAEVKATGTRESLEAYLAQYPKGKYVVLARAGLKKFDDAEKAINAKLALEAKQARQRDEQQARQVEQAAWDEARTSNTADSYSVYLEKYPSGRFAAQSKAAKLAAEKRITAAKRADEVRLQAELAKKAEQERFVAEAKKVAEDRIRAEAAKGAAKERERSEAEAKTAAFERARQEAAKKAEEERLAAEARKAEEQRAKEILKQAEAAGKQKEEDDAAARKQKEKEEADAVRKQKQKEKEEADAVRKQKEKDDFEAARKQKEKEDAEAARKQKEKEDPDAVRKQKEKEEAARKERERQRKEQEDKIKKMANEWEIKEQAESLRKRITKNADVEITAVDTASTLAAKISDKYAASIQAAIRPNITFDPDSIAGNPAVEIQLGLDSNGTIISISTVKSSGNKFWDIAATRALEKTERLPKDENGRAPPKLLLVLRPRER
jgi:TonB family protein